MLRKTFRQTQFPTHTRTTIDAHVFEGIDIHVHEVILIHTVHNFTFSSYIRKWSETEFLYTHTHTHKHAHTYTHTESSKLESNTTMWAKFKGVKIKCIFLSLALAVLHLHKSSFKFTFKLHNFFTFNLLLDISDVYNISTISQNAILPLHQLLLYLLWGIFKMTHRSASHLAPSVRQGTITSELGADPAVEFLNTSYVRYLGLQ